MATHVSGDEELVKQELEKFGFKIYDFQTIPPWCRRPLHTHDIPEIRGAVEGVTTFHFGNLPVTIEAGDILFIPAGVPHSLATHNEHSFSAFKGSLTGERKVTELESRGTTSLKSSRELTKVSSVVNLAYVS